MQAPDLSTLLDAETEIESAFVNYLTETMELPAVGSDSGTELQNPRLDVVATVMEQGPHCVIVPAGAYAGRKVFDQMRVKVELHLTFSPQFGQNQGNLRGALRAALTDPAGINAQLAVKGYYFMAADSMRQTDGGRSIDDKEKLETIQTTIEPLFQLNPAAFPA